MMTTMTPAMLAMASLFARLLKVTTPDVTMVQLAELCVGVENGTIPYETVEELLKVPATGMRVQQAINEPFSLLSTRTVTAREMMGKFPKDANLNYAGVTHGGMQYVIGDGYAWWAGKDLGVHPRNGLFEGKVIPYGFLVSDGRYSYKVQTFDGPTDIVPLSTRQPLFYDPDRRIIFDNESGAIWPWMHEDRPDHVAVSDHGHVCVLTEYENDYYRWDNETQAFRKLETTGHEFNTDEHDWPVSIDVRGNRTAVLTMGNAILFQDDKYVDSFEVNVWHNKPGQVLLRTDGEMQVYADHYVVRSSRGKVWTACEQLHEVQRLGECVLMVLNSTLSAEDHRSEVLVSERGTRDAHFIGQYLVQYNWHEYHRTEMWVSELRRHDNGTFTCVKVFSTALKDGQRAIGEETADGFRLVIVDAMSRRLVEYRRDREQIYVINLPPQHTCDFAQVLLVGDRLVAAVNKNFVWCLVDGEGIIPDTRADRIYHLHLDGNVLRWYARQYRNVHNCACRAN